MREELIKLANNARGASSKLALCSSEDKNSALSLIRNNIVKESGAIIIANGKDVSRAKNEGIPPGLIDRLTLNEERITQIIDGIDKVLELPDPIGEILTEWSPPSRISIQKMRVPIGVIGVIYESRPNVTVDTAVLTLKSGNSVMLRGSSSAIETNKALVSTLRNALARSKVPVNSVVLIEDTSRECSDEFMRLYGYIDALVPRGSAKLIRHVVTHATVPVIETGAGNCHMYIHNDASLDMAISLVINAKTQRPSVCNAIESLLIHRDWPAKNTHALIEALKSAGVECRGCPKICALDSGTIAATDFDWAEEFLDLVIAIKVVDSVEDAINHIQCFGTKHSESIITHQAETAELFLRSVDAAVVYHNASTRFTDGFEFGFGAELGISTQKLHARGPMGLNELTSYKYLVRGTGQIRG